MSASCRHCVSSSAPERLSGGPSSLRVLLARQGSNAESLRIPLEKLAYIIVKTREYDVEVHPME